MFLHRFLSLHSLTYPALAGSVQHDGGMVLSNQLRHQNGRKPWGGNMYLQHPSTEWLYLQEVKSANHTNVNILGIAISKSALILKANVGKVALKDRLRSTQHLPLLSITWHAITSHPHPPYVFIYL